MEISKEELQKLIDEAVSSRLAELLPKYADEEYAVVLEDRHYGKYKPAFVWGMDVANSMRASYKEQVERLRDLFPQEMDSINFEIRTISSIYDPSDGLEIDGSGWDFLGVYPPVHAEGWFVIPSWRLFADSYNGAVYKVLSKLEKILEYPDPIGVNGNFYDFMSYYENSKILDHDIVESVGFEETQLKLDGMAELAKEQGNSDILILPCQFGNLHKKRSFRRAIELMEHGFRSNKSFKEFPLGIFEIVIMLLLFPERMNSDACLGIVCAGDSLQYFKDVDHRQYAIIFSNEIDDTLISSECVPGRASVVSAFFPVGVNWHNEGY